jgi:hypothetical protein
MALVALPRLSPLSLGVHVTLLVRNVGARRRRSGSGPGGGCTRKPVGTYLYSHAVGASNLVAVLGLAR